MGQDKILEAREDLLNPTKSPYQTPLNLYEVEKYAVGAKFTREDMDKLWSTEDLLGLDERELLVWNHRLNHCSLKYLLRVSKRGMIPRNLRNIRKLTACVACLFVNYHKRSWSIKGKHSGGSTRRPSETRPRAMT